MEVSAMQNVPSGPSDKPDRVPGDPTRSPYADEAAAQDRFLDIKIAAIRAQYEAGHITVREAADARVLAYTHHLAAVRALYDEHFGNPATTEER
jgi:hypothetical protein